MSKYSKQKLSSIQSILDLDRAFIIFSVIYFPVSVLFLNNGIEAEVTLLLFTIIMSLLGVVLISNFLLFLSKSANDHSDNYGSILMMYVLNFLAPLFMFKVFAYVILRLLPESHEGFACDVRHFVLDIFRITQPQDALNIVILVSMITIGWFALRAVGRK